MRLATLIAVALVAACATENGPGPRSPEDKSGLDQPWPNWSPVGAKARPFRARNVAAGGQALELVPNQVNIIVFFATWSLPDKMGLIALEKAWAPLRGRGPVVRALSVDDDQRGIASFAKENGLTFDIGWDEGHRIADAYHPTSDPTFLVVDQTGIIRFAHLGYHDGEMNELAKEVESLLAGAPPTNEPDAGTAP